MGGVVSLRLIGQGHQSTLCIFSRDKVQEVSAAIKTLAAAAQSPLDLRILDIDTGKFIASAESSTVPARRARRW